MAYNRRWKPSRAKAREFAQQMDAVHNSRLSLPRRQAAAPELLAALKGLLEHGNNQQAAIAAARAAIAKAEGEE